MRMEEKRSSAMTVAAAEEASCSLVNFFAKWPYMRRATLKERGGGWGERFPNDIDKPQCQSKDPRCVIMSLCVAAINICFGNIQ